MKSHHDPFGAHGGSATAAASDDAASAESRTARARRLSSKIAMGLSAETAAAAAAAASSSSSSSDGKATRRTSQLRKATTSTGGGQLSQEEMQRKIEILMASPKLWQEFKQYLAETNAKTAMGTQMKLREFLSTNKEIAAKDAANLERARRRRSSASVMLDWVHSLSSEAVEATEGTPMPTRPSPPLPRPLPPRQPSASSMSSTASSNPPTTTTTTGRGTVTDTTTTTRSSFTNNASNMGKQFLRRAGEAATSSMSGLDREAEVSMEDSLSSLSVSAAPHAALTASSQDFMGVLDDWFGDEIEEQDEWTMSIES